ncbi:uncharacterized protein LOC134456220 isoform X2 [Engraulis encrasicolus]|uniref:uncharacterized protein LOC134456220 isoform X2 n=1 Tax=Engraulis encrasicolus TaxID=184585 RepID=UPI002FD698FA
MCTNGCFTIVLMWTLWSSSTNCQEEIFPTEGYYDNFDDIFDADDDASGDYACSSGDEAPYNHQEDEGILKPKIRVARWMDSDEDILVGCFHDRHQDGHFLLHVDTEAESTVYRSGVTVEAGIIFNVSVTPPVTFTCSLIMPHLYGDHLSDHHSISQYGSELEMPSVSLYYKVFSGFIGVVLIGMTLVVIAMTFKGKPTGTDKTSETNVYENTAV